MAQQAVEQRRNNNRAEKKEELVEKLVHVNRVAKTRLLRLSLLATKRGASVTVPVRLRKFRKPLPKPPMKPREI